ncbi:MAG: YccF domain-containing protein [candidate division KSB1 bacterium]|nr:YccF domain-containing protein [candidate division KSB1 bacterium]MDZ7295985.1 YccF domain-containing protein [candidate division KSB1 bacterium]MDZ7386687.1 YccF domain-containing protein [candidate division KSB1 bacterium]MDZ7393897.1 YccF domain-containing protein [candidate division KSB1 bacterium]MDZ7412544.1 YccF domain-containing protein [candidate division KSB1 bacterium]
MSVLGNILWILLGGFLIFLLYLFGGLILCLTVIGIPFGVQCFKLSVLALVPFGRRVVSTERLTGCLATFMNVLWLLVAGLEIAVLHLVLAALLALTIIGLPFAKQHLKLANLALVPFGRRIE